MAKMVGELILENDEVALPGVGTFVAELVGASFSDKGFVINPPYRKLSFRQREGDGSLLIDFYARTNSLEKSTAADILTRYLSEMKEVLKTKKYVVFPGLGRLRATRENLFFFVPDENLNIYPEGFGLEPVSLKSHEELEEVAELAETAAVVAELKANPSEHAPTPEEAPAQEAAPTVEDVPAPADKTAVADPIVVPPAETPEPVEVPEPVETPEPAMVAALQATPAAEPAETQKPAEQPAPAEVPQPQAPKSEASSEHHHHHHHHSSEGESHSDSHSHSHSHSSDGQSHHHTHSHTHSHSHHHSSSSRRRKLPVWQKELLILLGFAAAFLILLAVLGRVAPQFVDRFLYTREELEILYR